MLHQRDITQYGHTGYLPCMRLLTVGEAQACRDHFLAIEKATDGPLTRFDWSHLFFRWAYELTTHPDLLDVMEALLGPDLLVWGTLVANKPPQSAFRFAWHQDSAFCKFLGDAPAATAWIALTDSNPENGCLQVLPGSHTTEVAHAIVETGDNVLQQNQQADIQIDKADTVDIALDPGEMSIQHMSLLHNSSGNQSPAPRVGFIVRFATPMMKSTPYPMMRVRGQADCSHLDLWSPPQGNDIGQGLSARDALIARLRAQ